MKVDLTTEVRWFFSGRLPDEVLEWFDRARSALVDERVDSYRIDGQLDIGLKRRYGTTLELKLRLRPPEPFQIGQDLDGRLETWRRWSPADDRVYLNDSTVWLDIEKTVMKRRFDLDGVESPLSPETRGMDGRGCDVEVAVLAVNGQPAWTFAFSAFGPIDDHEALILSAWETLDGEQRHPRRLRLDRQRSCGYPEWMARFATLPKVTT